jgi:hypothetical protein
MSAHGLYEQRQSFFLTPSATARGGIIFCVLVGLVTFVAGLVLGEGTRAWGGLIFNWFFFFSISLGGIAFAGMQDVIGATWARPVTRIHESFASFLPFAGLLLAIFFACVLLKVGQAHEVYRWVTNQEMLTHFWGKRDWLKPGFWIVRDLGAVLLCIVLAFWQLKRKLARDMAFVRGEKDKARQLGDETRDKLRYWSAPILVVYALTFTMLAFDLTMSLAPTWVSTLWGGWNFAIMMQTLMATLLLFMFWLKDSPLGQVIRRQQFHDVGKLMHGFTIFFAYLTYAHVLTYWFGNVPEETEYFIHRLHQPWLTIVLVTPILAFVLPLFALIPKASKWTSGLTVPISAVILFAQWLTNMVVVMPDIGAGTTKFTLPWMEIGLFLGMLGLFLTSVFWFGKRFPMLSVGDPLLAESLEDAH